MSDRPTTLEKVMAKINVRWLVCPRRRSAPHISRFDASGSGKYLHHVCKVRVTSFLPDRVPNDGRNIDARDSNNKNTSAAFRVSDIGEV